jgi:5-formyltetrahydrofolate cyclo-ligase
MALAIRSIAQRANKMSSESVLFKARLRQQLRGRIGNLSEAQRAEASAQACSVLAAQPVWNRAQSVLFYSPLRDELDLSAMLDDALGCGKVVALPRFVAATGLYDVCQITDPKRDCAPGKFGIHEPSVDCPIFPVNRLDLALVPGVGFDSAGHRLGRGGGHYDRLLTLVTGVKCGVALDEQLVHQIPAEPHDIHMDYLLTATRWIEATGNRPS